MAVLGRWSGGSATQPTTSWASPNGLGTTQVRNDGSAYSWSSSSARLTLPSSDLADGYLIVARINFTASHNNRYTMQGRFTQNSGTGNFLSSTTGGYSRNNTNNQNYINTWAVIDNPSASATFDLELKRDTGDGTVNGSFTDFVIDVIPLFYSDIGLYSSTNSDLLGGTTPQTQPLTTTVLEGTNITRTGNVITVTGDNKRYLVLGSNYTEGRGGRTQRWVGCEYDGVQQRSAMACVYHRDTGTDENGIAFSDILETSTADRTIEQFIYRGDGVANNQGGANIDGSNPSVGAHAMAVIELNDSAEVIKTSNTGASAQAINSGTTDINSVNTVDFNDSASFTSASASAINIEQDMDLLAGANTSAAYNTVSSGTRYESRSRFTINGTEDADTFHGNYGRGNQGSADTFGHSTNPLAFLDATTGQDLGVSNSVTGNGGPVSVQPAWAGLWAINLDSLEDAGGTPQTVVIGLQSETESEISITPVAGTVTQTIGLNTETESEFSLTFDGSLSQTIGLNTETETEFSFTLDQTIPPINQAIGLISESETELSFSFSGELNQAISLVSDSESVFSLTQTSTTVEQINIVSETESVPALISSTSVTVNLGLLTESEQNLAFSSGGETIQAIELISESENNLGFSFSGELNQSFNLVTESESVFGFVSDGSTLQNINLITETESLLSFTAIAPIAETLGLLTESESVLSFSSDESIIQTIALQSESESNVTLTPESTLDQSINILSDTETALSWSGVVDIVESIGIAIDTEGPLAIVPPLYDPEKFDDATALDITAIYELQDLTILSLLEIDQVMTLDITSSYYVVNLTDEIALLDLDAT